MVRCGEGGGRGNFVRDVDGSTAATREAVDCTTVPDVVSTACTFTLSLQCFFPSSNFASLFFKVQAFSLFHLKTLN